MGEPTATEQHITPLATGALIRRAREARGWSQGKLGSLVGTSQQTIDRLERGLTSRSAFIRPIADALDIHQDVGLDPLSGIDSSARISVDKRRDGLIGPDIYGVYEFHKGPLDSPNVPVFSIIKMPTQGLIIGNAPIKTIIRPEPLLNVRDAYGLVIADESMSPVLRAGDIVFVNPHLSARLDSEVLMLVSIGEYVRAKPVTLMGVTAAEWVTRTWDATSSERHALANWSVAHVIVGKFTRM